MRGLQVALERNSLRLVDVGATVPGTAGDALRHARMIGVELAGLAGTVAERLNADT